MRTEEFSKAINDVLGTEQDKCSPSNPSLIQHFLARFNTILSENEISADLKMTRLTILFEAFYRNLNPTSDLKITFLNIRQKRWAKHFGTPTISFLLTYHTQIETLMQSSMLAPWEGETSQKLDKDNQVLVKIQAVDEIELPVEEKTGEFTKTYNNVGGFTTTPCDPVSRQFIEYAISIADRKGKVLEIGAAFGAASLKAIAKGTTLYCNDIDPRNLAVVRKRYAKMMQPSDETLTGDDNTLVLIPGEYPDELSALPNNTFDAILICRVLHFFPGALIEKSLRHMGELLKTGGKLFIVCESPYLKNWQRFVPEYDKRVKQGIEWPGEIINPSEYEISGRAKSLPQFVHWITKDVIDRALLKTKLFSNIESNYIDRRGQFPQDLLLDGRESVGTIAIKK